MVSRADWINGLAAVGVLATGIALAISRDRPDASMRPHRPREIASGLAATTVGPNGTLKDSTGFALPLKHYRRIAGGSLVADRLLLMLCEPDRIVAFSSSAATAHQAYRFQGKPALPELSDVEAILAQDVDLLIVNNMAQQPHLQRLREAGVAVFDLGGMHGIKTLVPNIEAVGLLVGHPERAEALKLDFLARATQIADGIRLDQRRTAMYVGLHGDKMYGGTVGSSFHDVLTVAGLVDAAADVFVGWPRYTSEQLLSLDPQVIVTQLGMRRNLCNHPGLSQLQACAPKGRIIELDPALLLDPGLPLLEAAARVHHEVYQRD